MRSKFLFLLAALFLPLSVQAETLTFAPLPMESKEAAIGHWRPLLIDLEKAIGATIRLEYSDNYEDNLEKFKAGKIDLIHLGPLPYVALRKEFSAAQPIIHCNEKNGTATYTCAIIAPADAKLKLKDLKNKKIALTQALSTCGYLSTQGLMQAAGRSLEQNRYRYLGKHDEVALAIARGEFDAGGLKTSVGKSYAHMGLAVLAETPPLPGFALIANGNTLSGTRIQQIRDALLSASPEAKQGWGENRYGVVAAHDQDYQAIRQFWLQKEIPKKGNF